MNSHHGSCHCGKVEFQFEADEIKEGLRCNCSICKRLGIAFSLALPPERLTVLSGREHLKTYQFGDKDITHIYCTNCGIYVFYESKKQCRVNLGCVDEIDTFSLKMHFYDGKNLL